MDGNRNACVQKCNRVFKSALTKNVSENADIASTGFYGHKSEVLVRNHGFRREG